MSHDAPTSAAPGDDAKTADAHTPAIRDARTILLIVVVSIAVFAAIVQLFVL